MNTSFRPVGSSLGNLELQLFAKATSSTRSAELVLVSGNGYAAQVMLFIPGGFGTYLYEPEQCSQRTQVRMLSGVSEYQTYLSSNTRKELARKKVEIPNPPGMQRALTLIQRGATSPMIKPSAYGLGMVRELLQQGMNFATIPTALDPKSDRDARAVFEKVFGRIAFLPTFPMTIQREDLIPSLAGRHVLRELLATANLDSAVVTSGYRDPASQARVMYQNLRKYGVTHQLKLYGPSGDKVIKVYADNKAKQEADVIILMKKKIEQVGPQKVSHHCLTTHDVFDVDPASIAHPKRFEKAIQNHKKVSRSIFPPKDPAYHIEVPKA